MSIAIIIIMVMIIEEEMRMIFFGNQLIMIKKFFLFFCSLYYHHQHFCEWNNLSIFANFLTFKSILFWFRFNSLNDKKSIGAIYKYSNDDYCQKIFLVCSVWFSRIDTDQSIFNLLSNTGGQWFVWSNEKKNQLNKVIYYFDQF